MTMRELAKLANVSVSTVSKAFGGAADINSKTKERIFEIAREMGCYNKFYKGKYPKNIIAIICPEIISNHYASFVDRLRIQVEKDGNIALVATDNFSKQKQQELIDYFSSYLRVDGIIVFGLSSPLKKDYDTPIVSLFSSIDEKVDSIKTDIHSAMDDAVSLLLKYGHKNIAFLSEPLTEARVEIFKGATRRFNFENATVIRCEGRFEEAGEDGIDKLINTSPDCTAIICAYDNIAFGAIKRLKTRGLSVPDDISVIGIDNIIMGKYAETSLTTIGVDVENICEKACEILQKKLKNPYFRTYEKIIIKEELILRETIKDLRLK